VADPGLDRMVFVDLETMGLDPEKDPIIEMGFRIIESETLNVVDDFEICIWESPYFDQCWENAVQFVKDMHQKSGLHVDGVAMPGGALTPADALDEASHWLKGHGVSTEEPMCGSSVQFDRGMLFEQYPDIHNLFGYRNIDISTLKELCRRLNSSVYERLEEVAPAKKLHRVISDLDDTIAEFAFYRNEFLIW
jgi:oligoribonuclease